MKIKTSNLISYVGLGIHLALFIAFTFIENLKCNYRFLGIDNIMIFILTIMISIFIPLLLCVGSILSLKIQKEVLSKIIHFTCTIILYFWIAVTIMFAGFFRGGISSYTDNIENYKEYDEYVTKSIESYEKENFLPNSSTIIKKYSYKYNYGPFSENFWIELEAIFENEEDYQSELERLLTDNMISYNEIMDYEVSFDGALYTAIIKNDSNRSIKYFITYGLGDSVLDIEE